MKAYTLLKIPSLNLYVNLYIEPSEFGLGICFKKQCDGWIELNISFSVYQLEVSYHT